MNNFTHGIIAIDPLSEDEDDMIGVAHFAGYWTQPTEEDLESLKEELKTDETFGLTDICDRLVYAHAPDEIIKMMNEIVKDEK
jgi:hypothetical protein